MSDDVDAMVAWLREVHEADEQAARDACEHTDSAWRVDGDGETLLFWDPVPDTPGTGQTLGHRIVPHVARHDPADTLARIEGERRILDMHVPADLMLDAPVPADADPVCFTCERGSWPCTTLRALAYGYRNRGGWQEGWAP